jgi:hypothetical protein
MSLEGLQYLLDKKEVVPTASAIDLRDRPENIEAGYLRHVRTYIPMSRYADGASFGVEEFERRLIKRTREGRAPRGYITAGYGYGKTSTALYLWQRAQAADLLTVPPFQLEKLPYLIEALYGWARYQLGKRRPALIPELETIYHKTIDRSLEQAKARWELKDEKAAEMLASGALNLDLQPTDYVAFFDGVTEIAAKAGYNGVVLIADELQQFIRPRTQQAGDPISPLFNILQLLGTREADSSLAFGLIISMTLEEVAMIRDSFKRGDLLARMKELSLDLTDLYDNSFAANLWNRMAQEFDFTAEAEQIVEPETLTALGNITGNKDISDGPRTVVNVLRRMVEVYFLRREQGDTHPYSPFDLMDDFLDEQTIYFAGNEKLRTVTRGALNHSFVQSHVARYAPAIKLIAAFGVEGVPRTIQEHYGQGAAIDELMQKTIGDVVRVGSNLIEHTVALVGLDSKGDPDWLKETIRNFRIGWNPSPDNRQTRDRTLAAFTTLLKERIFPKAKVLDEREGNMVSNRALILEVDVPTERGRHPKRRLHIRLYWDEEPLKDASILGDVCIEYRLGLYSQFTGPALHGYSEEADAANEPHTVLIPINLQYLPDNAVERPLHQQLKDVWSPYELSPLVLLNIYQLLVERAASGDMPKSEMSMIESAFLPEILDYAVMDLFNEKVGARVQSAGEAISEYALRFLIEQRYPDYVTLMGTQSWASTLAKYKVALERLDSPLQRSGQLQVPITKTELAEKFTLSNTALDTFLATFGTLLHVDQDLSGKKAGAVTFTLHPLESTIMNWLRESDVTTSVGKRTVKRVSKSTVVRRATTLGYLDEEIEKALDLLTTRDLITVSGDWVIEAVAESLDIDVLKREFEAHAEDVEAVKRSFVGEQVRVFDEQVQRLRSALESQLRSSTPDAVKLNQIGNTLKQERQRLRSFGEDKRRELTTRLVRTSVSSLKENELSLLKQPLTDEIDFVDQVNVLRSRLNEVIERTSLIVVDHNNEVLRTKDALRSDIAFKQLADVESAAKRLEHAQSELQAKVSEARDSFRHYEQWRSLVKNGAAAARSLHELNLDGVGVLREDLQEIVLGIRAEISSRKLDALADYSQFIISLESLVQRIEALRQNARATFASEKNRYIHAFTQMDIEPEKALVPLAFNPSEPTSVYTLLHNLAISTLQRGLNDLQRNIRDRLQTAQVLQMQAAHLSSRERHQLEDNAAQAIVQLEGLGERLSTLQQQLDRIGTADTLRAEIDGFAQSYLAVRGDAQSIYRYLEQLRRSVSQLEPNSEERELQAMIEAQAREYGGTVNVFTLQSQFPDHLDAFWQALRGLLEKDCILLSITLPSDNLTKED